MPNLNVESLNQIVQSGNIERLFKNEGVSEVKTDGGSELTGAPHGTSQESSKNFADILKNSLEKVNGYQAQADTAIKELVAGRNKNIHETLLTVERADASLKLMMQVRNKILDAYREIMRMQV